MLIQACIVYLLPPASPAGWSIWRSPSPLALAKASIAQAFDHFSVALDIGSLRDV